MRHPWSEGSLEQGLFEEISAIETIDCHEHLPDEHQRVAQAADVFTLFSHYTCGDLVAAGMPQAEADSLQNRTLPLDLRWQKFEPYWRFIRHSSYARAALLAAERFYGEADVHGGNYAELSRAVAAANRPGLYRRVLKEACGLKVSLAQRSFPEADREYFVPVVDLPFFNQFFRDDFTWRPLVRPRFCPDGVINSLDEYLAAGFAFMDEAKGKGAVGFKTIVRDNRPPDRRAALEAFRQLQRGEAERLPARNPLTDYLHDEFTAHAGRLGLPVAVHAGYWGDFRQLNPQHLIPVLQRHPGVRFDVYHLGFPWWRETLMMAKTFPNMWLNLCWTHIISQRFTQRAIAEALETVPLGKVSAFGGDYGTPVEKVYGHLVMAREDLAVALGEAIRAGRLTADRASNIATMWLYENPKELYGLRD